MEPWQRFGRQRLAQSRWNCEPAAIDAVDRQAFEAAWQRQAQMEQLIVAQIAPEAIPAALLEGLATSLGAWLDEGRIYASGAGGDRPAPRPAGKRLRRDCQPGAAAGSRHGAGLVSAASGAVYAPGTASDPPSAAHRRWRRPGGLLAYTGASWSNRSLPRGVCAAGPATLPLPGARWTAGGWGGSAGGCSIRNWREALFALAENALSAPVASELGWHLIWCEAIRPAAPMTPEQALESARDYLSQQSQRRHQRQWLAEMLARQPKAVRVADRLPAIAYSRCGLISSSQVASRASVSSNWLSWSRTSPTKRSPSSADEALNSYPSFGQLPIIVAPRARRGVVQRPQPAGEVIRIATLIAEAKQRHRFPLQANVAEVADKLGPRLALAPGLKARQLAVAQRRRPQQQGRVGQQVRQRGAVNIDRGGGGLPSCLWIIFAILRVLPVSVPKKMPMFAIVRSCRNGVEKRNDDRGIAKAVPGCPAPRRPIPAPSGSLRITMPRAKGAPGGAKGKNP